MHTTPSKPVNPESLHAGYEVSDARPSLIIIAMVAIGLMGAAAFPICFWIINDWDATASQYNTVHASPVAQPLDQVPPAPHLQQYPREDADKYLKASAEHLNSFGVVAETGNQKTVHIPIEKAIDAVASGKASYRQKPTVAADATQAGAPK